MFTKVNFTLSSLQAGYIMFAMQIRYIVYDSDNIRVCRSFSNDLVKTVHLDITKCTPFSNMTISIYSVTVIVKLHLVPV